MNCSILVDIQYSLSTSAYRAVTDTRDQHCLLQHTALGRPLQTQHSQRDPLHAHACSANRSVPSANPPLTRRPGEPQGLTYLLLSRGNRDEVHVVQTYHVDNPHLLVAGRLGLGKLAEGQRLGSQKVASRVQRHRDIFCHTRPGANTVLACLM